MGKVSTDNLIHIPILLIQAVNLGFSLATLNFSAIAGWGVAILAFYELWFNEEVVEDKDKGVGGGYDG